MTAPTPPRKDDEMVFVAPTDEQQGSRNRKMVPACINVPQIECGCLKDRQIENIFIFNPRHKENTSSEDASKI